MYVSMAISHMYMKGESDAVAACRRSMWQSKNREKKWRVSSRSRAAGMCTAEEIIIVERRRNEAAARRVLSTCRV